MGKFFISFLATVILGFFTYSYAVIKKLEGKVKNLSNGYVSILVFNEGCVGLRKFKIKKSITYKIEKGKRIIFKAEIDRSCNGKILEIEEVK
ncbi:MAG: hypothetical protein GXO22_01300 [Aquificae bacterium]|nr:hypothetical protein [Aquificota bacterium]